MKTTIEINGYEIVISVTDESIQVSAIKDDETIEEFTLEAGEELPEDDNDGEIVPFEGDEEDDFDGEEEEDEEEDEEEEDEEEEDEEGTKLESFNSFIKKRR